MHTLQCTTRVSNKGKCLAKPFFKTKRALILENKKKFSCKAYLKLLNLEQNLFKIFQKVIQNFSKFCSRFFKYLLPNSLQSLKNVKTYASFEGGGGVFLRIVFCYLEAKFIQEFFKLKYLNLSEFASRILLPSNFEKFKILKTYASFEGEYFQNKMFRQNHA